MTKHPAPANNGRTPSATGGSSDRATASDTSSIVIPTAVQVMRIARAIKPPAWKLCLRPRPSHTLSSRPAGQYTFHGM